MTVQPAAITQSTRKGVSRFFTSSRVAVVFALVFLYLALRGINWATLLATLGQARPGVLAGSCVLAVFAHCLRALRWRVLLNSDASIRFPVVFWANSIGYLGNYVLPARAGELLRCIAISLKARRGVSYALATAVTERLLDAVVLLLIFSLEVPTIGNIDPWLVRGMQVVAISAVVALTAMAAGPSVTGSVRKLLRHLPLRAGIQERFAAKLDEFVLGGGALRAPGRLARFLALTAAVWSMDAAATMLGARAFALSLTFWQTVSLLAALGLSSAIPSTPGYVGVYQFVAVSLLPSFGVPRDQALAFILAAQAVSYVIVTTLGLMGLWRLGLRITRSGRSLETTGHDFCL